MHITLRANEKIYLNGAVLKVDRKTSIELLNDAVFLLEAHVMLERDATSPMRQLYYIVQLMLMAPRDIAENRTAFAAHHAAMLAAHDGTPILDGLAQTATLVGKGRYFEALKLIRTLVPIEDAVIAAAAAPVLQATS